MYHRHAIKGFTLVELSIVLVIIGLIAAGTMTGQTLINQAKIRATLADIDKYRVAYDVFVSQYGFPPGDLPNATSYWSGATNGNGTKIIDSSACNLDSELYVAWRHLSLAGLISGSYTGAYGSGPVKGSNTPPSKYTSDAMIFIYGDTMWGKYRPGNSMYVFRYPAGSTQCVDTQPITVKDAWSIDTKTDDGLPGLGKVISMGSANGVCTDTQVSDGGYNKTTAAYVLSSATALCSVYFSFNDFKFE